MLRVQDLVKSYGATPVLNGVSFIVNDGEHAGLIGPNGCGKTTLLRCIAGLDQPDAGSVFLTRGQRLGYLPQALTDLPASTATVGEAIAAAQGGWADAEAALRRATELLAAGADERTLAAYDAALTRFEALGGYAREHRAAAVLDGLGLGNFDHTTPVAALSGGQKTRLGLAALLLAKPDLLLLDEPLNHLDIEGREHFEAALDAFAGTVIAVAHDRAFLRSWPREVIEVRDGHVRRWQRAPALD